MEKDCSVSIMNPTQTKNKRGGALLAVSPRLVFMDFMPASGQRRATTQPWQAIDAVQ